MVSGCAVLSAKNSQHARSLPVWWQWWPSPAWWPCAFCSETHIVSLKDARLAVAVKVGAETKEIVDLSPCTSNVKSKVSSYA